MMDMRSTQAKIGAAIRFNIGYKQAVYSDAVRLGMAKKEGGQGGPANGRPQRAKTKAGRINLIRHVYARMVREGQIIPPIGDA
jgi:hypothetical protein